MFAPNTAHARQILHVPISGITPLLDSRYFCARIANFPTSPTVRVRIREALAVLVLKDRQHFKSQTVRKGDDDHLSVTEALRRAVCLLNGFFDRLK
jgi:hypothetical protein